MKDIEIINITTMEKVLDETYSDNELMEQILTHHDDSWSRIIDGADECGVSFDFEIDRITDYKKFVESFVTELVGDNWNVVETEPTLSHNIEVGHPDFRVEYEGEGETAHKDDTLYVEFKNDGDSLRKNQIEWILENITTGRDIWVLWIEDV